MEDKYESVRVTPRAVAGANRVSYSLLGRETKLRGPQHWAEFLDAVDSSDIIHLHAIHSHVVDTGVLFRALIQARKPVVWTLHDQWAMTGRCAQPAECRRWESGCSKCPDLAAYPPAKIDHAGRRWVERREMVAELQAAVPTAIIACASWLASEARLTSLAHVSVIKNSVDREFWNATVAASPRTQGPRIRNLFMCRDLRDEQKVDWVLLEQVAALPNQDLTIVGNHAPRTVNGALNTPAVSDRAEISRLMQNHDRLVFTSRVDYFPLTIVEALTSGMEVYALDSLAAREFADNPRLRIFADSQSLLTELSRSRPANAPFPPVKTDFFAPDRMTDEYLAVYQDLLGQ